MIYTTANRLEQLLERDIPHELSVLVQVTEYTLFETM